MTPTDSLFYSISVLTGDNNLLKPGKKFQIISKYDQIFVFKLKLTIIYIIIAWWEAWFILKKQHEHII